MMMLLGRYYSPYTRRVGVSLRLLGMRYKHRPLSTRGDQQAVRAVNPVGRVPALVLDNGEVLVESSAILDYLDGEAGPEHALLPASGERRRRALQCIALAIGAIEKVAAALYEQTRRPPEKLYQPWIDQCLDQASSALGALEARAGGEWIVGDRLTQADITAAVGVTFIGRSHPALVSADVVPNLAALTERCEALSAFAETRPTD